MAVSIVLHRHREDEELLLAPAAPTGPVEIPRGIAPARLGCVPGTSRAVVDELRAETVGQAWERAVFGPADPAALIQHAWQMALAPLEQLLHDPLPDTDWTDVLAGAEANTFRMCSRGIEACTAILNGWHVQLTAVTEARQLLVDDSGIEPVGADELRQGFAAVSAATEDALAEFAAEWILAGTYSTTETTAAVTR